MFPLSCVFAESNTHGGCEWGLSRIALTHDPYLGGTFTSNEQGQRQSSARRFGSSIAAREKERRNGRCLGLLNRERLIEHKVLYWEYIRNKDQIVHNFILHYIALYHIILYYIVLYYIVSYDITLYCTILYYIVFYSIIFSYTIFSYILLYHILFHVDIFYLITLYHIIWCIIYYFIYVYIYIWFV